MLSLRNLCAPLIFAVSFIYSSALNNVFSTDLLRDTLVYQDLILDDQLSEKNYNTSVALFALLLKTASQYIEISFVPLFFSTIIIFSFLMSLYCSCEMSTNDKLLKSLILLSCPFLSILGLSILRFGTAGVFFLLSLYILEINYPSYKNIRRFLGFSLFLFSCYIHIGVVGILLLWLLCQRSFLNTYLLNTHVQRFLYVYWPLTLLALFPIGFIFILPSVIGGFQISVYAIIISFRRFNSFLPLNFFSSILLSLIVISLCTTTSFGWRFLPFILLFTLRYGPKLSTEWFFLIFSVNCYFFLSFVMV